MGATAFQRRRRAKEDFLNNQPIEKHDLSIDDIKEKLDELGVKYSHNTGEAKLREKLSYAIS